LSIAAATLTIEILKMFDTIEPKKQNLSLVSHCGKVKKIDGLVDFIDAILFYNKYRAYKSWPDIFLESKLKIKECSLYDTESLNKSGKIVAINKESVVVGCLKGKIEIFLVQPSSKKQMSVVDYIRGKRFEVGDIIS
jgi:methionyl-tRNA formyltransferase